PSPRARGGSRRSARCHARRNFPGPRRPQSSAGGGSMKLRSPIVAILWETWRVTRVEAAWKLAFCVVATLAALTLSAVFAPSENAGQYKVLLFLPHIMGWLSLA